MIARHPRHWGKEHTTFDPIHYLALLEKKPGAIDFPRPLENWQLPECFATLRRRLEADHGHRGTREFIKVLRLLEGATLPELARAVSEPGLGPVESSPPCPAHPASPWTKLRPPSNFHTKVLRFSIGIHTAPGATFRLLAMSLDAGHTRCSDFCNVNLGNNPDNSTNIQQCLSWRW